LVDETTTFGTLHEDLRMFLYFSIA